MMHILTGWPFGRSSRKDLPSFMQMQATFSVKKTETSSHTRAYARSSLQPQTDMSELFDCCI